MIGFISHLIGDIITEAYDYTVNPFWPVSNVAYTLSWTKADSKVWNWGTTIVGYFFNWDHIHHDLHLVT
jgi:hypothetical protein